MLNHFNIGVFIIKYEINYYLGIVNFIFVEIIITSFFMLEHKGSLFIIYPGKASKPIKTQEKSSDLIFIQCFLQILVKILISLASFTNYQVKNT